MELMPICTKLTSPEIRQKCMSDCTGPSPQGVSPVNIKCELQCSPIVKCLQSWANQNCDDMKKLADTYVKELNGNTDKIKKFISKWNTDVNFLTTKPDILRLIGEIVGKFRVNLTCFANRVTNKLGLKEKLNVPDDLDLGLAAGAKAIPKFLVYILIIIGMVILGIFTLLPFARKNPIINLIPIILVSISMILIIYFFNNY